MNKAGDVDLVLTDHHMPEMDGLQLAAAMREQGIETPIILLSSNPSFADKDPARAFLHSLMQKPVPRKALFAKLKPLEDVKEEAVPEEADQHGTRQMRVLAAEDNKPTSWYLEKWCKI